MTDLTPEAVREALEAAQARIAELEAALLVWTKARSAAQELVNPEAWSALADAEATLAAFAGSK